MEHTSHGEEKDAKQPLQAGEAGAEGQGKRRIGSMTARELLAKAGQVVGTGAFLVPAIVVAAIVAGIVSSYVPLEYQPTEASASESDTPTPELTVLDAPEEASAEPATDVDLSEDLGVDTSNLKDGTYTGSGTGFTGTITVQVTISGGRITNIQIVSSEDSGQWFESARGVVQEVLDAQSTSVDVVSGATYSSHGILQAIRNALAQASGGTQEALDTPASRLAGSTASEAVPAATTATTPAHGYADGTYTGNASCHYGPTTVSVTISGGRIARVDLLSSGDDYMGRVTGRTAQVVERQSANIDNVTGATYSSRCLRNAVQDALNKAASAAGQAVTPIADEPQDNPDEHAQDDNKQQNQDIPAVDTSNLKDGEYTGTGVGFEDGETVMRVTVADGRIASIDNVSNEDTNTEEHDEFSRALASVVPQVISKQSAADADIDAVTGATYSRRGILQGIANALAQAQGKAVVDRAALEEELARAEELAQDDYTADSWDAYQQALESAQAVEGKEDATQEEVDTALTTLEAARKGLESATPADEKTYQDGTYTGHATCEPDDGEDFDPYTVALELKVEDGVPSIVGVEGVEDEGFVEEDERYLEWARLGRTTRAGKVYEGILDQIVKSGGDLTKVDVVSGATCSSKAIKAAYEDALAQAEVKEEDKAEAKEEAGADTKEDAKADAEQEAGEVVSDGEAA